MIHDKLSLINIFCEIDDFYKKFLPEWNKHLIEAGIKKRERKNCLSISEIMTILILYQNSKIKDFKTFYFVIIKNSLLKYFPKLPSYDRFLRIQRKALIPLFTFLQYKNSLSKKTDIYYVDSTSLSVCKNQIIHKHKTFEGIAQIGKTSMG